MRLTSHSISASIVLTFCAAASVAQAPLASADASPSANTAPQSDTREVPASSHTVSASQIRIVRLSEVKGQVQLNRNTGQSFELAFNNLPIIAGEQLRTLQGVAEVEFEDNSSLRLTPDSQVDFPTLGRDDAGAAMTAVTLLRGTMYVSLASTKTVSNFTIHVGHETLTLAPASHFRLDTDSKTAKLTVFQGEVTAVSDSGSLVVSKHKAATFDLNSTDAPVFARMDEPSPFDTWDKNAVDYHKALAIAASNGISPYSYGTNDLAYYGSFSNVGGCGLMWRPYLASASFSPYASGVWAWYPGSGYSWVSPYPWGWTPYHSGSWSYCEGAGGWGWQPQGNWNGLANQPAAASFKISGTIRPHRRHRRRIFRRARPNRRCLP